MEKTCETCKWWEEFNWACCNGDSEYCADFTEPGHVCECWEEKED